MPWPTTSFTWNATICGIIFFAKTPGLRRQPGIYSRIGKLHDWFRNPCSGFDEADTGETLVSLGQPSGFTAEEFFFGEAPGGRSASITTNMTQENSFIHYLWAIKATHAPLFMLASVAHQLSVATGAFHTVSTGFAGFLGYCSTTGPAGHLS